MIVIFSIYIKLFYYNILAFQLSLHWCFFQKSFSKVLFSFKSDFLLWKISFYKYLCKVIQLQVLPIIFIMNWLSLYLCIRIMQRENVVINFKVVSHLLEISNWYHLWWAGVGHGKEHTCRSQEGGRWSKVGVLVICSSHFQSFQLTYCVLDL